MPAPASLTGPRRYSPNGRKVIRWSIADKDRVLQLYVHEGRSQHQVARETGIPQTTLAEWINAGRWAKLRATRHNAFNNAGKAAVERIEKRASETISNLTHQAGDAVSSLLTESFNFGKQVVQKANGLVSEVKTVRDASSLLSLASAGKCGVGIARQALGLDDERRSTGSVLNIGSVAIYSRSADPLAAMKALEAEVMTPVMTPLPDQAKPIDSTAAAS